MDFRLNEEQEMMKKMAHDFAVNEIAPYAYIHVVVGCRALHGRVD